MRTFVKEIDWIDYMSHGWGNGYVLIPVGHPLHGIDYHDMDNHVDVHYGLTYGDQVSQKHIDMGFFPTVTQDDLGAWVFGFDTAHYDDDMNKWPKEAVEAEASRLMEQLRELGTDVLKQLNQLPI